MKPIVIIKETNKDGKFELTEKELKELIEQAYEQGYADAKAEYKPNWTYRNLNGIPIVDGSPTSNTNDKIYYRDVNPNCPHDIYGNPVVYCDGSTTKLSSTPNENVKAFQ